MYIGGFGLREGLSWGGVEEGLSWGELGEARGGRGAGRERSPRALRGSQVVLHSDQ